MYLAKMTWEDVGEYLKDNDSLLIPIGTCEQHGYHSPLGTDTFIVDKICKILAAKYDMLIAPSINYGIHFDVDNDYPGVGVLKAETVKAIFADLRENWVNQGFRKLIVVSFHAVPEHYKVLENLGDNYYLVKASEGDISDLLDKQERMIHACEAETSIMLYTYPELMRMDKAVDTEDIAAFQDHLNRKEKFDITRYPGNLGYSTYASSDKGKMILNRLLFYIEQQINEIVKST